MPESLNYAPVDGIHEPDIAGGGAAHGSKNGAAYVGFGVLIYTNWLVPAHRTQVKLNRSQMTPASQWKQKKVRVEQTTKAKEKTSGARTAAIRAKERASMILEGS